MKALNPKTRVVQKIVSFGFVRFRFQAGSLGFPKGLGFREPFSSKVPQIFDPIGAHSSLYIIIISPLNHKGSTFEWMVLEPLSIVARR